MAEVKIKLICGCGFSTEIKVDTTPNPRHDTSIGLIDQITPAIDHVERTGHTINSIVGTIKPTPG